MPLMDILGSVFSFQITVPRVGSTIVRNWPETDVPMQDRIIGQFRRIVAPTPASRPLSCFTVMPLRSVSSGIE